MMQVLTGMLHMMQVLTALSHDADADCDFT